MTAQALRIDEIVRNIFIHFQLSDELGDLARAAMWCKTISPIALDVLWEHAKDIIPLFRILPGFQQQGIVWVR